MTNIAFAEWLQSPERLVSVEDATLAGRWGDLALAGAVSSAFDAEASATAEADRQIAFKGGPLVEEEILIPKKINVASVRGRVRSIKIAGDPDYGAGVDVFIIGGELVHGTGITKLFVLRRL